MPIHLPQLSRREFLKRAGLAGLALALTPRLAAEALEKPRDPHTIAFFSDAHIAADPKLVFNDVNMTDHLTKAVQELGEWATRPAAVIVNGDLAYRTGLAADYDQFSKVIQPVRALAPVHLSLGNHDNRANFWSGFPLDATAQSHELDRQATVFSTERANWFLLDSLDQTNHTPGIIGETQRNWLEQQLALRPDKPAIVVAHHNLQLHLTELGGLIDSPKMIELLSKHTQVKAFVYGHTHDWHVETHKSGVHLINLPPTAYVFKPGRPSGWVRATLTEDGAEFELRSLSPHHAEHAQIKKLTWRPA